MLAAPDLENRCPYPARRGRRLARGVVALVTALLAVCAALVVAVGGVVPSGASAESGPTTCLAGTGPDQLDRLFAAAPGGVLGADYQRATSLPDGRVLWTFQDAEVQLPSGARQLVHNIAMVQDGTCFRVLMGGTPDNPQSWLFGAETRPFSNWYWPLGAEMGADGQLYVFAAQMVERSPAYLGRTEPVATVTAIVDANTLEVRSTTRPADASASLHGFSIESDNTWTYLFAQCHRQFGFEPYIFSYAHDFNCASRVTVARVPKGQLLAAPTYWTASGWRADPAAATPILDPNRLVNASQFVYVNNQWMVITKVGDWWGDRIVVEFALRPVGPFVTVAELTPPTKCAAPDCNNYFASWIPSETPGQLMFGLSHNRWDGIFSEVYRPTFATITAPPRQLLPAERCSLGYCG